MKQAYQMEDISSKEGSTMWVKIQEYILYVDNWGNQWFVYVAIQNVCRHSNWLSFHAVLLKALYEINYRLVFWPAYVSPGGLYSYVDIL